MAWAMVLPFKLASFSTSSACDGWSTCCSMKSSATCLSFITKLFPTGRDGSPSRPTYLGRESRRYPRPENHKWDVSEKHPYLPGWDRRDALFWWNCASADRSYEGLNN